MTHEKIEPSTESPRFEMEAETLQRLKDKLFHGPEDILPGKTYIPFINNQGVELDIGFYIDFEKGSLDTVRRTLEVKDDTQSVKYEPVDNGFHISPASKISKNSTSRTHQLLVVEDFIDAHREEQEINERIHRQNDYSAQPLLDLQKFRKEKNR